MLESRALNQCVILTLLFYWHGAKASLWAGVSEKILASWGMVYLLSATMKRMRYNCPAQRTQTDAYVKVFVHAAVASKNND